MKRISKSNWRTIASAAFATVALLFAAHIPVSAQGLVQSNRLSFGQFFTSPVNQNLWLKDVTNNFKNLEPNVLLNEDPAQDDKLPKPDFSAMDEWYEIRKWEYDFYSFGAKMNLVIVARKESRPKTFDLVSKDADGVIVPMGEVLICGTTLSYPMVVNQPYKCALGIPEKKVLRTVKTMRAVERE